MTFIPKLVGVFQVNMFFHVVGFLVSCVSSCVHPRMLGTFWRLWCRGFSVGNYSENNQLSPDNNGKINLFRSGNPHQLQYAPTIVCPDSQVLKCLRPQASGKTTLFSIWIKTIRLKFVASDHPAMYLHTHSAISYTYPDTLYYDTLHTSVMI